MPLKLFHPVIQSWFSREFKAESRPQLEGWPVIAAGNHALISAPTGSGKTLTAFLAVIDRLIKELEQGTLGEDETRVVYVSPLRALSNDMQKNLARPLEQMAEVAQEMGLSWPKLTIGLRTGDTTAAERLKLVKHPPHMLITTPESLYLYLTSARARLTLNQVDTLIVDEIHSLIRDKRGSHFSLTMERLKRVSNRHIQRIGLSATQKPLSRVAEYLTGVKVNSGAFVPEADSQLRLTKRPKQKLLFDKETATVVSVKPSTRKKPLRDTAPSKQNIPLSIIDVGHQRDLDLQILGPQMALSAVCSYAHWAEVYQQIVELINSHRSTLIFVNTRRMAERIAHQLGPLLGEDAISSHHGSLASDLRLSTEQRLKRGELKAVVATASLELGIDIGYIDLVIQIGSPRSIATFLQRIGRSGHALGLVPKGRLIALTRDELIECMALVTAIKRGELDKVIIPDTPLDVLAQQIVAEVAAGDMTSSELWELLKASDAYHDLTDKDYQAVLNILSEGVTTNAGRSRVYLHYDQIHGKLRARPGARLAAINNAGAIPDLGSYRVVVTGEEVVVGTVDEDFAVESQRGDIFVLGSNSWRIEGLRSNDLMVSDAQGAPPSIPFWRGEAPGRTFELSYEVSRLRTELVEKLKLHQGPTQALVTEVSEYTQAVPPLAYQGLDYLQAQINAIGLVPTQETIVFERFFDESGGMQVVVHAPFGGRITRAWGLAMRKRFCRSFDFELQAQADDDGFILTLGPQHSFPLESLFSMLTSQNVQRLLEQAVLAVPTFQLRWRWNVANSLIVQRRKNGKRVPPPLQRFRADDLLTAVFPRLTGCQENITGDHELPDHPLINQTMKDCLYEAFDLPQLKQILERVERGEIKFIARDTREPSPFSYELINANPYAFLDGEGEVFNRRARTATTRRGLQSEEIDDLTLIDREAIDSVIQEAAPFVRDPDELHDLLLTKYLLPEVEALDWKLDFQKLSRDKRATRFTVDKRTFLVAAERLPAIKVLFPTGKPTTTLKIPASLEKDWDTHEVRRAIIRGILEYSGPITAKTVAEKFGWDFAITFATLESLEGEGTVIRGWFLKQPAKDPTTGEILKGRYAPPPSDHDHDSCETAEESTSACQLNKGYFEGRSGDFIGVEEDIEWCHRRLLARMHRRTLGELRKQIEPVSVATFHRFLAQHQGLNRPTTISGVERLLEIIEQLQGLEVPAIAWEREVFSIRCRDYDSAWLDQLCFTGEICWGRVSPPTLQGQRGRPMVSLSKHAPITLILREDLAWILPTQLTLTTEGLSSPALEALTLLKEQGARFTSELQRALNVVPAQLVEVLGELVSRGFVTADGFAGLRGLIGGEQEPVFELVALPYGIKQPPQPKPERQRRISGSTGRWGLWCPERMQSVGDNSPPQEAVSDLNQDRDRVERWAWLLLKRWGVIFRDLLEQETSAPAWFQLVGTYRRLEAQGQIRGGRFIKGVAGEQFALADSIQQLRNLRDAEASAEFLIISAADPLNLTGIISKSSRITTQANHLICYLNGEPVAHWNGKELTLLVELGANNYQQMIYQFHAKGVFPGQRL